jgi:RimJ/RimL family protein N-acetyltransferase
MNMVDISKKFDNACDLLRTHGTGALIREAVRKVGVLETYLGYGINLRAPLPEVRSDLVISVRKVSAADFERFRKMPPPFPRHAQVHERYGLDQCYVATVGDEIAHVVWLYYPDEQDRQPTRWLKLRPDEAEFAIAQTLPQFRGRRVYPHVFHELLCRLRDEGYLYAYAYIEPDNIPSRRGIDKVGFKLIGRSWRLRFFYHYARDPAAGIYIHGPCARRRLAEPVSPAAKT